MVLTILVPQFPTLGSGGMPPVLTILMSASMGPAGTKLRALFFHVNYTLDTIESPAVTARLNSVEEDS